MKGVSERGRRTNKTTPTTPTHWVTQSPKLVSTYLSIIHLDVSNSLSCQAFRNASLQCRAASKKNRQCQGSLGGDCLAAPAATAANSCSCCSSPLPDKEREREEAVEDAADVVALLLVLCWVLLREERTSPREPP